MLTTIQINLFVTSRIFKNSFQELCIHFIMANAQKNYWVGSNTTGSPECIGRHLSDSVLSNWQESSWLHPSAKRVACCLNGRYSYFVDESTVIKPANRGKGRFTESAPGIYSLNKFSPQAISTRQQGPPTNGWLTSTRWPDWGQPVSNRLQKESDHYFLRWGIKVCPLTVWSNLAR